MRSYLLKAGDEEFDRWRAAAVRAGGEKAALAPWIRAALDAVAVNSTGSYDGVPMTATERELLKGEFVRGLGSKTLVDAASSFKPDFKK